MTEALTVGEAFCQETEADELFAYISNEFRYYSRMVAEFRRFETEMKWGDYVAAHNEARLMPIANEAAMAYTKTYCGGEARYRDMFPLASRVACANVMAKHFELEKSLGNSWLG